MEHSLLQYVTDFAETGMCRHDHDGISNFDSIGTGRNDDLSFAVNKCDQKLIFQRKIAQCFAYDRRGLFNAEFDGLCAAVKKMVQRVDLTASGCTKRTG